MMINHLLIDDIIVNALKEDIGFGDITSNSTIPEELNVNAVFLLKDDGVVAGLGIAERLYKILDKSLTFSCSVNDGMSIKKDTIIATVSGSARSILTGERVALNFLQRMSGIATATSRLVEQLAGTKALIVDTRKTVPGLRVLDKYSVRMGGGYNHRFGLDDGVLIKDNHVAAAGSIREAVQLARLNAPHMVKIEVEVTNFEELNEAMESGADAVLLDNMTPEMMRTAVGIINGRALTEASGGITLDNVAEVAETGVDLISAGYITHSVKALDISLEIES